MADLVMSFAYSLSALLIGAVVLFCFTNRPRRLRHPPSPLALPVIGHLHLLGPLIHHSFHELASRYGPLIQLRLGSDPCVVASTPELAKEFLKTNELSFSSRKHSIAIKRLTYDVSFAFAPYGPYWKFIKKFFTYEILGNRVLNQFLPIRTKELHSFLQFLLNKANAGEAVNVSDELMKLTNNIISQMMLSIRCSGTDDEAEEARTLVREVTKIFGEFNVSDFIWFCRNLDLQGIRKRSENIHKRYDALLENIISRREELRKKKQGGDSMKDFLDMLLDVSEDENSEMKLTRNQIKALILDFFTAATDTSAISIEWALAELINNPQVLKKAQEEIEKVVGRDRLVGESDCPNLPYIQAIIKETLRLHPPIPMLIRKSVQDCKVDGYNISAKTMLFVNIWSIGRNPKYWESPLEFRPERFLQPGKGDPMGGIDVKGQHFELLPFGTGRRGCPGMSLALQELPTVVAAMIQCFEWKLMTGDGLVDMEERPGLTAPRAHDLVGVPVARIRQLNDILDPLAGVQCAHVGAHFE